MSTNLDTGRQGMMEGKTQPVMHQEEITSHFEQKLRSIFYECASEGGIVKNE